MRAITCAITVSVILASATSHVARPEEAFCTVDGPHDLVPATINKLRLGMTASEVEKVLGKPHYSPTRGQYYYGTNDNCAVMDGLKIYCGYVLNYANDQ